MTRFGTLFLTGLAVAAWLTATKPAPAEVPAAQAREASDRIARWAIARENVQMLASAVDVALRSGASLDPGDPWSIHPFAERLKAMPGGAAEMDRILSTRARGVITGVSRIDIVLSPGSEERVPLTMAADEPAIVEARLKRGSDGANLDLRVYVGDTVIAQDTSPDTGAPGVGTFVEFLPDTCVDVEVAIFNAGSGVANAVMLAPASSVIDCRR
ncbi:MAG: hypothetical protein AAGJ91_08880 [Pseudomonadota bacterium]